MTRLAVPDDAEAVAIAHARGWQVAYRGVVPDSYLDSMDMDQRIEMWRGFLENDTPTDYVAEVDGLVVGFANVGVFRGDEDDPTAGELWAMYVHPDHWGTGAGYALMQTTMEHFKTNGVRRGYLWVLEQNPQARRFYERQGWSADDETVVEEVHGVALTERRYSITLT